MILQKKVITHRVRYRQFNRTEKERKIIVMIKKYTKQVMQKAIAHDPLTKAQSAPEQQLPPPGQLSPVFLFSMTGHGIEYPFGQFGSVVLAMLLPSCMCIPSLLAGRVV